MPVEVGRPTYGEVSDGIEITVDGDDPARDFTLSSRGDLQFPPR